MKDDAARYVHSGVTIKHRDRGQSEKTSKRGRFWFLLLVRKDLLYPTDPPILQSHLDAARVVGGRRQDILYNPDRSVAGSLVLFQDDRDVLTGTNVLAILAVHIGSDALFYEPPALACSMAFCEIHGVRVSPAGKLDLPTAVAQLLQQNMAVVALDLYHTVFNTAPGPALCLELSSELFQLLLTASQAGNHGNAFPFAPFRFPANPHQPIAAAQHGFLPMTHTFVDRPAALGTHSPLGGRVDNPMITFLHLLHHPGLEFGDFKISTLRIIADLVHKANLSGCAGKSDTGRGAMILHRF
jgi:hypothetical protein